MFSTWNGSNTSGNRVEVVEQRLGLEVHVDEHEAGPRVDLDRLQAEVVVGPGRELLGIEHEADRPVEVPAPAVERADQRADAAAAGGEARAAVAAGVEVAADGVGRLADHEDRVAADQVLVVAADAGDVLEATRHQPRLGEQPVDLDLLELGVEVAALRHERLTEAVTLGDEVGGDVVVGPDRPGRPRSDGDRLGAGTECFGVECGCHRDLQDLSPTRRGQEKVYGCMATSAPPCRRRPCRGRRGRRTPSPNRWAHRRRDRCGRAPVPWCCPTHTGPR